MKSRSRATRRRDARARAGGGDDYAGRDGGSCTVDGAWIQGREVKGKDKGVSLRSVAERGNQGEKRKGDDVTDRASW